MKGLNNPIGMKSLEPSQSPFIMNPFRFGGAEAVGGWTEVGRTTNGSALGDISVASLPDKRYYMILGDMRKGASTHGNSIIMNADTGTSYSVRRSVNGGSDSTNINLSTSGGYITDVRGNNNFNVTYVSNLASKEKLWQNQNMWQSSAGAGNVPGREEGVGKWANTSNAMSTFTYHSWGGNYGAGSECVVLGWDPVDEHTTNFWEELASVTASGSSDTLSSSITAKKYLWIQGYTENTTGSMSPRVGSTTLDSSSNYATRLSSNGGAEDNSTASSITGLTNNTPIFWNMFIINNASNEKLMIWHVARQSTAGAGNFPKRIEGVTKWANTSNQIDIVGFVSTTGGSTINSNSIMKVWGSD